MATHQQRVKTLVGLDAALERGPDYKKLALQGAAIGAVASVFLGRKARGGALGHAAKYGAYGAGLAAVGALALFEVGKIASAHGHKSLATAVGNGAGGEFAGWDGGRGGRGGWEPRHEWDREHERGYYQGW